MKRVSLTSAASLVALAGLLTLAPLFGEDTETKTTKTEKETTRVKTSTGDVAMPSCLEKLKLTDEQHTKIQDIVTKYDADIESVWGKFKHRYRDTIRTEVLLITAIEDNLTDEQQKQVRMQRRKLAHEGKMNPAKGGTKTISETKPEAKGDEPKDKSPAATAETIALESVNLSAEQEQVAQELHDKYFGRLRTLSREIDSLHTRLVSLEADELAEIETVLTKEQITQLREGRKDCPAPSKVTDKSEAKVSR